MAEDWSMLPLDILADIVMKLKTLEDFIYFSVVCRWWNCVPRLIENHWKPKQPWLLLAENTENNPSRVRKIYTLSHTKCHKMKLPETFGARCWGSPYGWVAMIDIDLNILLFNPITKARLSFPHWNTLPNFEDYESYRIDVGDAKFAQEFKQYLTTKLFVLKVRQNDHDEFVIMMLYCSRKRLVIARQGDLSWTPLPLPKGEEVLLMDIISIGDNACAVYNNGLVAYWKLKDMGGDRFGEPITYLKGERTSYNGFNHLPRRGRKRGCGKLYMIHSGSDIFMLFRFKESFATYSEVLLEERPDYIGTQTYRTVDFAIIKYVRKDQKWEEVNDLGDIALFVGNNNSMTISTRRANHLRRNCIYFTDDENEAWNDTDVGGHDMGVYDLGRDQISPLYEGDCIHTKFSAATFFIPESDIGSIVPCL